MGCADNSVVCVYITASWMFFKWHKELLILEHAGGLVLILQNLLSFIRSCALSRTTSLLLVTPLEPFTLYLSVSTLSLLPAVSSFPT